MTRRDIVDRLEDIATRLRAVRDPDADPRNRLAWVKPLQSWQSRRLGVTFADLLDSRRFRRAAQFFLTDLYGEQDVSWRARDLARMMPTLVRWLPGPMLETVCDALELDWLSHKLDLAVAARLDALGLDPARPLTVANYARAYREAGDRTQRARQLDLLREVGVDLDWIVRKPLVYAVLKLARGPAEHSGLGALQGFLERGFAAFREMGGAKDFLDTIDGRERAAMERMLAGTPDPFGPDFDARIVARG
jgi:hypothetical protein